MDKNQDKRNDINKKSSLGKVSFVLILICVLLAIVPLFALKDAEFGGSDDAGSEAIAEINKDYEPWAEPILEKMLGGELPGEVESLLFCVQTGIGIGVLAFFLGRFVQRCKDREIYGISQDEEE